MIHALATLPGSTADGRLVVIRTDGAVIERFPPGMQTVRDTAGQWPAFEQYVAQAQPDREYATAFEAQRAVLLERPCAAIPRTWQVLYGSAYGNRAARVFQAGATNESDFLRPLMYQGASDAFLPTGAPFHLPDPDLELDCEPEIGVVLDHVPQGVGSAEACAYVRLLVFCNDFTYRKLIRRERPSGFGFIAGKPPSSMAPLALPLARLGEGWRGDRLHAHLHVRLNDTLLGAADTEAMEYGFGELIARAAMTRPLTAGTIIFSGTIAHPDQTGASSLIETRAKQTTAGQAPRDFLGAGDRVDLQLSDASGNDLFGNLINSISGT